MAKNGATAKKFEEISDNIIANDDVSSQLLSIRRAYASMEQAIALNIKTKGTGKAKDARNNMFTADEQTDLEAIVAKYVTLTTDLKTNYKEVLGLQ